METWQTQFADRGLVPFGAVINDAGGGPGSLESARSYYEDTLHATHPWAADIGFAATSRFFPGPSVGTPGYIAVDLATMEIVTTQEGYSGVEESLFEGLLRPE